MDLTTLHSLAANNDWMALFPELLLVCLALLLLVLEIVLPGRHHSSLPGVALFGVLAIIPSQILSLKLGVVDDVVFNGLLHQSSEGQLMRVFFLLCAALVCLLGMVSLGHRRVARTEFYHIVLVVTAAMMLLAQSNHFVMLFVALETVTVGFYILVSYFRSSALSLEAGLKYLVMGAFSSSVLLFGIVLLYGVAGNPELPGHTASGMNFTDLGAFLAVNPHNFLAAIGIVLVLSGVAFKIGAFPFQIWIPDVYQGAPTPVTAFLAVGSKAAGFIMLLILVRTFSAYAWLTLPILTVMAGATLLFGNLAALSQRNVKRLIGLSGVSHAGFLLVGVVAAATSPLGYGAIYFYLFAYLIASFAVFGVMAHVAGSDDADQDITHYAGLARERPFLALVLALGLGSLAGIPPLAGFMGKFFIFIAAFQAGSYALLTIAVLSVVISIYYYFGWIRAAFFSTGTSSVDEATEKPARAPMGLTAGVILGVLAIGTVVLGFYQAPFGQWLSNR